MSYMKCGNCESWERCVECGWCAFCAESEKAKHLNELQRLRRVEQEILSIINEYETLSGSTWPQGATIEWLSRKLSALKAALEGK